MMFRFRRASGDLVFRYLVLGGELRIVFVGEPTLVMEQWDFCGMNHQVGFPEKTSQNWCRLSCALTLMLSS